MSCAPRDAIVGQILETKQVLSLQRGRRQDERPSMLFRTFAADIALDAMTQTKSLLVVRIVLGIVAAIGMSIPIGITIKTDLDLKFLERTAKVVTGSVAGKNCSAGGTIYFRYTVDGSRYESSGRSCGLACKDAKTGDTLKVIYSSEKPQLSRCDSLHFSQSNVVGNWFGIIFGSLLAGYWIFSITRVKNSSNSATNTKDNSRGSV